MSELVSNALLHGRGDPTLTMDLVEGRLRITVHDEGGGTPAIHVSRPDEPHGRGLRIVERVSTAWGIETVDHSGTTVWAEMLTTR